MNHYDWLDDNLEKFFYNIGVEIDYHQGLITAHGDKCYDYEDTWKKHGIPFHHGVAIYLLSYIKPYDNESRETDNGWMPVNKWVINNS